MDTQDVSIALDIRLPWLLEREEKNGEPKTGDCLRGTYLAGAMLQGARWFNRYLKPRGWQFVETAYGREEALDAMLPNSMLGLRVSQQSKHAVLFQGKREDRFVFLNNRKEGSMEPEFFVLTKKECFERLEETVWIGRLEECAPEAVDFVPLLEMSLENWGKWREEFLQFAACRQEWDALCLAKDTLFRAFLLDGLAVCGLVAGKGQEEGGEGEEGIEGRKRMILEGNQEKQVGLARRQQEWLGCLQRQYLAVMRRKEAAVLAKEMDMELAHRAVEGYQEMIRERLAAERERRIG